MIIESHIDGYAEGRLGGWAFDRDSPSIPLEVGLFSGETLILTTTADQPRADLLKAGVGNGACAFCFQITRQEAFRIIELGGDCYVALVDDKNSIMGRFKFTREQLASVMIRRVRCNVDIISKKHILGWCLDPNDTGREIVLGLYVDHEILLTAPASLFRDDLVTARIGTGKHGFRFEIDQTVFQQVLRAGNVATLRDLSNAEVDIATINLPLEPHIAKDDSRVPTLRSSIFKDLGKFVRMLNEVRRIPTSDKVPMMPAYDRLLLDVKIPGEEPPATPLPGGLVGGLSGFLDYSRFRMRKEKEFDITATATNAENFLHWYINVYGKIRASLRAPLSKREIDFLNQQISVPGQEFSLSRATWSYIFSNSSLKSSMDLNNRNWHNSAVYWWSTHMAPSLYVEDCLVPRTYIDVLRVVSMQWYQKRAPLSIFMEQFFNENVFLHVLDCGVDDDRTTYAIILLILGVSRPDYIRFIPPATIREMFKVDKKGETPFSAFLQVLIPRDEPLRVSWEDYVAVLLRCGYDPRSNTFRSVTKAGNRVGAAALPRPDDMDPVDVQIVGPFTKASGLGQATRLSASALDHTSLKRNYVDFDLDNPAPEGFSKVGRLDDYRRARINLIHLNAESIPLVFAYEPDVFTGAYNIGYFFWELDSPAACHYLALEVLDEVWVSTEYGKAIYTRDGGIPVKNVGMCFEDVLDIDRERSRDFVESKIRATRDDFVFLAAFDSFSFVQRKNPIGVIRAFQMAFRDEPKARLLLKTQNRDSVLDPVQMRIWSQIDVLVASDQRITVLNETLSYNELVSLKKGCDCYVSLHRSEGWGFGMIEAMNLRVPVICTGYSGNMDFCSEETAWIVGHNEVELNPDDYIFVRRGQKWAEPDVKSAADRMRSVFKHSDIRTEKVESAWQNVQNNFSAQAIGVRYERRIKEILAQLEEQKRSESGNFQG